MSLSPTETFFKALRYCLPSFSKSQAQAAIPLSFLLRASNSCLASSDPAFKAVWCLDQTLLLSSLVIFFFSKTAACSSSSASSVAIFIFSSRMREPHFSKLALVSFAFFQAFMALEAFPKLLALALAYSKALLLEDLPCFSKDPTSLFWGGH